MELAPKKSSKITPKQIAVSIALMSLLSASLAQPVWAAPGDLQLQRPTAAIELSPIQSSASAPLSAATIQKALGDLLKAPQIVVIGESEVELALIRPLYSLRAGQPAFVNENGLLPAASELKELIAAAPEFGLKADFYWSQEIDALSNSSDATDLAKLDLLLTQALVRFSSDVSTGRISPRVVDNEIDFKKRTFSAYSELNQSLVAGSGLRLSIEALEPQQILYKDLKQLLKSYLDLQTQGGIKPFQPKTKVKLKEGANSPDVIAFRARLTEEGYMDASQASNLSPIFDSQLTAGVKAFQKAHKLTEDGVPGPKLIATLNTPINERIDKISANLERLRWLPTQFADKYVIVNLAFQELHAYEMGQEVHVIQHTPTGDKEMIPMKTVNGRELRRSPTMPDKIVYVALNPYWNAPASIVAKDILPQLKKNPAAYVKEKKMKIFTASGAEVDATTVNWNQFGMENTGFSFRQEVGDENSLGVVKFNLTNSHNVYMHDTPHKDDFPKSVRLYSSGCIRLEHPLAFAEYLLQGTPWDGAALATATSGDNRPPDQHIPLANPMPVYVMYTTISVEHATDSTGAPITDETGKAKTFVRFSPDYYGQDSRVLSAMQFRSKF